MRRYPPTLLLLGCCVIAYVPPSRCQELPVWDTSVNLRSWAGFKDNVLLGNSEIVRSPFLGGGLDLFVFRFPQDGTEFTLFTTGDYVRYFPGNEVQKEIFALGQARVAHSLNEQWKIGFAAESFYFDQVFDNTVFERELGTLQVKGLNWSLRPEIARRIRDADELAVSFNAGRFAFQDVIDDYWEFGPKLAWTHEYGFRSEWEISYEYGRRLHDSRLAREAGGEPLEGRVLEFDQHELQLSLRHHWDEERRWRTVSRLAAERNIDNGGGYYNYWRPQMVQQVRYRAGDWELRLDVRASHYFYDSQPVRLGESEVRRKTTFSGAARIEYRLRPGLTLFGEYEYERSWSNLAFDRYAAHTVFAGIDWEIGSGN